AHQRRIAAVAVAGQHKGVTADALARAVAAHQLDAAHAAVRAGEQSLGAVPGEDGDAARLRRRAQAVDQLRARPRRQAVHAEGGMAGIIEVVDHLEREAVGAGEPLDRLARDHVDDSTVVLAVRLLLDVVGKQLRRVRNTFGPLEARAGGGNEPGRQRRRTGRHRVALDEYRLDALLLGGQRRAQPRRSGADDQQRHLRLECLAGYDGPAHRSPVVFRYAEIVVTSATGRMPSIAAACTSFENAAQPSESTVQWISRTCASRTVEATPPLVRMPPTTRCSIAHLRSNHSSRVM